LKRENKDRFFSNTKTAKKKVAKKVKPMPFGHFAVLPSNTVATKRKFLRQLSKARKDLEKRQKEWAEYNDKEKPAFTKWLHQTFGKEISELRDTHQKILSMDAIINEIEKRSFISGKSPRKCYQEVLEFKELKGISFEEALWFHKSENADLDDDGLDSEYDIDDDDFIDDFDDPFDDDFDDDMEDDFDGIFSKLGEMFGFDDENPLRDRKKKHGEADVKGKQSRLKDVYRKLCLQLHPDTGCEFSPETKALWHEAQEAYKNGDIERLESIQCRMDLNINPLASHVSCSQIIDEIKVFKSGMHSISSLMQQARKDISWGFMSWNKQKEKRAKTIMKSEMFYEMRILKDQVAGLERVLANWSKSSKNKAKPSGKNKNRVFEKIDHRQGTFNF